MTLFHVWPALQTDAGAFPEAIHYERAVLGKVHGAPTDFRWIARSARFAADCPDPAPELNLGGEDLPARFQAWRCIGDRYYAISIYPSRSIDAFGRRGFLEKQVLEWRRPPGVPAAAGALLLLPYVTAMTDAIWWERHTAANWMQPETVLPIDAADHQPLAVDAQAIAIALERGRQALRDTVGPKALTRFYDQVLNGRRPALLADRAEPLPPEALAALLVVLPRELADRVSLAGWIPSGRALHTDLATRWDALVVSSAVSSDAEPSERAWAMAEDLFAFEPGLIGLVSDDRAGETTGAAETPPAPIAAAADECCRPGAQLDLTPPEDDASSLVRDLYEFARNPLRRWLDVSTMRRRQRGGDRVLVDWVQQTARQRPHYANEEQWQAKVDLLKSAAIAFLPVPDTVQQTGIPDEDSRVPALLLALLLSHSDRDSLAGIGEDALRRVIVQSLTCRGAQRHEPEIRQWLQEWRSSTRRPDVRDTINEALQTHRT
ncbi:MAG: hypothetical protein ACJ74H_02045 [Thermoanaerobaculia bacterium]